MHPFIWYDGALLPQEKATTHVLTHALHMGGAAVDGIRVHKRRLLRASAHLNRLRHSAEALGFVLPWGEEDLLHALDALVWSNKVVQGYLRLIAWRGADSVSVASPRARIHVALSSEPLSRESNRCVTLWLSRWRRPGPDTAPVHARCSGGQIIGTLGVQEARKNGCTDALFLDRAGRVVNTSEASLIIALDGSLVLPESPSLDVGLTARHLGKRACDKGANVEYRPMDIADVARAEEVIVASSHGGVRSVTRLRGPDLDLTWSPGPWVGELFRHFEGWDV
ncbi:MAG: aminotransferase class IV [Paracoccaceae bacterium]